MRRRSLSGLHHSFVVAVTVTNLVFWVILGGLVALCAAAGFGGAGWHRCKAVCLIDR
jgi:predicted cobalt transporter CbtA